MGDKYSLDVACPEQVAIVLETVAQHYRESASELWAAWGDESAGRIWNDIAIILDRAASSCERARAKRGV